MCDALKHPRRKAIYEFIVDFRWKNQFSPTFREIAHGIEEAPVSLAVVSWHISKLVEAGYLTFVPGQARTLVPHEPTTA